MQREKLSQKKFFRILNIIKNTLFAVILVALVALLAIIMLARFNGKTPSVLGFAVYRVSSGSMEPTLNVGDVILSHECSVEEIKSGDIVTYSGTTGEFKGLIITHRVEKAPYKKDGEYYLVTKGDNNPVADTPIKFSTVKGKMLYKIDFLKSLYSFFVTPWGLLTILGLIILVFFNEIIIFLKTLLNYREEKSDVEEIIERYHLEQLEAQKEQEKLRRAQEIIKDECQNTDDSEESSDGEVTEETKNESVDEPQEESSCEESADDGSCSERDAEHADSADSDSMDITE